MRSKFAVIAAASAAFFFAGVAGAQTAEQLEQLSKLTPQQRAEALKAFEKLESGGSSRAEPLTQPEVVTPAPVAPAAGGPSTIEQRYAGRTDVANLRQTPSTRGITQTLQQFGYDLFAGAPSTFAPATDIPVPADYVIGPGDMIDVQLFGKENEQHQLVVSRDGRINFPQIGAISVAGLSFTQLRNDLEKRVAEQMIGVKASIAMGPLRSIRVFVLGDVTRPGSYTVSALSTMTNALFVSGGIQPIGSLRNVQLKRNGRLVTRLDLYDLLLRGDTSDDVRLQPGDVIFVPPIGQTAAAAGEVRRPAIYELRGEKTVKQLIEIAGGLLPTAVPHLSQIERLDAGGNLTLLDVDLDVTPAKAGVQRLGPTHGPQTLLADGDVLRVYRNLDRMEGVVLLAGHVRRPGGAAWNEKMRLTDLIPGPDHLLPQADLNYVVIRREGRPLAKISVFSTRLAAAWAEPQSEANPLLEPRDQVFVFPSAAATPGSVMPAQAGIQRLAGSGYAADLGVVPSEARDLLPHSRQALLQPLLEELTAQSSSGEPTRIVSTGGLVREPGNYPLEPGMRVADLIRASGGLREAAYVVGAEITRYEVAGGSASTATPSEAPSAGPNEAPSAGPSEAPGVSASEAPRVIPSEARDLLSSHPNAFQKRSITHIHVDLAAILAGDATANVVLQPHDKLVIKRLPEWAEQLTAEVRGEVRFPGVYPIKRGERLSDLLARAGGLTDQAFPEGSVFTREELRLKEQERLDTLARQLEEDIAAASLEKAQEEAKQAEALATARSLLPQLKGAKATGRLVVDLPRLLEEGEDSSYDVVLKDGDRLIVPQRTQEVTVIGEVQYPTSHLAHKGLGVADYVNRSGGFTYKADNGRAYVVRANGQVEPAYSGWWIFRHQAEIRPGDTIVVPLDVDRMRPLTLWASVTQIVYQLAVTLAVLNNIGAI